MSVRDNAHSFPNLCLWTGGLSFFPVGDGTYQQDNARARVVIESGLTHPISIH